MKRLVVALALALMAVAAVGDIASAQPAPVFKLGFKALADQIPDVVGVALESEHFSPLNGDSLQHTSIGLMVWRKADNWTAFTNGSMTWVNGPYGLQTRPNDQRFGWELGLTPPNDLFAAPAPPPAPAFPPVPTPAAPQAHQGLPSDAIFVKASDKGVYVLRRGYRWVMPDWGTYLAYGGAPDLSNVRTITDQDLAAIPWGGALSNIWVDMPIPMPTAVPVQPTPTPGTPSNVLYGRILVNGRPGIAGIPIEAVVNNQLCGQGQTDAQGGYQIGVPSAADVPGCGVAGTTVSLRVVVGQQVNRRGSTAYSITEVPYSPGSEVAVPDFSLELRKVLLVLGLDQNSQCSGVPFLDTVDNAAQSWLPSSQTVTKNAAGITLADVGRLSYSGQYEDCSTGAVYSGPGTYAFGVKGRPELPGNVSWHPVYQPKDTCAGVQSYASRVVSEIQLIADQSPLDQIDVVGFSLGGLVVSQAVTQLPPNLLSRIHSLLLLDSPVTRPVPARNPTSSCSADSPSWNDLMGSTGRQTYLANWYSHHSLPFPVASVIETPIGSILPQNPWFLGQKYNTGTSNGFAGYFIFDLLGAVICGATGGVGCVLGLAPGVVDFDSAVTTGRSVWSWGAVEQYHGDVWKDPTTATVAGSIMGQAPLLNGSVRMGGSAPPDGSKLTAWINGRMVGSTTTYSNKAAGYSGLYVLSMPGPYATLGSQVTFRLTLPADAPGSQGSPVRESMTLGPGINPVLNLTVVR